MANIITPDKEGWLKKRGARMHRWSTRYFALVGHSLTYKLKQESNTLRGTFDLVPGCILTEVEEDVKGAKKGKKIFSFWIVWPHVEDDKKTQKVDHDSDGEEDAKEDVTSTQASRPPKDLKQIVQSEVNTNRDKQRRVEEQLEKHHAQDNNLSIGMKVAAVAVGGVVVGALTAGIGLVPYITVVGITAVASGGAVAYQYRRPTDSRLILASESLQDALSWKAALEEKIAKLEANHKPMLPASADPLIISHILGISGGGGGWVKVGQIEAVRIMQQGGAEAISQSGQQPDPFLALAGVPTPPVSDVVCRKTQVVVQCSPISAFLSLMDVNEAFWPKRSKGTVKVVQAIDDHVDILGVSIPFYQRSSVVESVTGGTNGYLVGCLSRFWFLDEDGSYLITLSPTKDYPAPTDGISGKVLPLAMDAVLTVSPRRDHEMFDDDLMEALVTCTVQINTTDKTWARLSEVSRNEFMNEFVGQLLEMRQHVYMSRYDMEGIGVTGTAPPSTTAKRGTRHSQPLIHSNSTAVVGTGGGGTGVTTMQPGAGEGRGGGRHLTRSHSSDIHESTSHSRPNSPQPNKYTGPKHPSHPLKERSRGLSSSSRHGIISRSHKVNAEASSLRSQIATKEFELARLEKVLRKKGITNTPPSLGRQSSAAPTNISSQPSVVVDPRVTQQVCDLQLEVKDLKAHYLRLTGVEYSQSNRRPRLRGFGEKSGSTAGAPSPPPSGRLRPRSGSAGVSSPSDTDSGHGNQQGPGKNQSHTPTTPAAMSLALLGDGRSGGAVSPFNFRAPGVIAEPKPIVVPFPNHWAINARVVPDLSFGKSERDMFFLSFIFLTCFIFSIMLSSIAN